MKVSVPAEVKNNEFRVAITPAGVHELVVAGHVDHGHRPVAEPEPAGDDDPQDLHVDEGGERAARRHGGLQPQRPGGSTQAHRHHQHRLCRRAAAAGGRAQGGGRGDHH